MRVHQNGEDHGVEEQVHGDDVGERVRAEEDVALQQGERNGQQRSPLAVAQFPQERDEDDRLQQVRLPGGEVPQQEGESHADEE